MTDATSTLERRQRGPMTLHTGDQSPEQRFTGTWYACTEPTCWSAVLCPSAELVTALESQGRTAKAPSPSPTPVPTGPSCPAL
ncbi:hypothetical protein [Streptomyces sp. SYSU K217416]